MQSEIVQLKTKAYKLLFCKNIVKNSHTAILMSLLHHVFVVVLASTYWLAKILALEIKFLLKEYNLACQKLNDSGHLLSVEFIVMITEIYEPIKRYNLNKSTHLQKRKCFNGAELNEFVFLCHQVI